MRKKIIYISNAIYTF
uniref:Uncharacterized protein n=1 Tax=Lepeophtheirus salmonis TaxID=72036 RepID=A0A0K2T0G3_LEPSM